MENNYPIPRNILDGYDVAGLMHKMAKADWYYDYAEDPTVWNRGLQEIKLIKEDLAELCKMDNGVAAANYLWDAYVPVFSVSKPVFLRVADELEVQLTTFDWTTAFYDPLHDTIEASTLEEKEELARMEELITGLQERYHSGPSGKVKVEQLVLTYWKDTPMEQQIDQLFNLKNDHVMNTENLAYLKDNIKYQGFGESLYPELESQLKSGAAEFSLPYKSEVNKKDIEATLHFKKSDSSDMYFFNRYDVRTTAEKKDETMAQTFYLNKGRGVTLKEAYNLLNGRAVHKELVDKNEQKYQAWVQLDFGSKDKNGNYERRQFHQNWGYDLKEALSYFPIKEMMKEEEKEKLIRSLEKGNVQSVTLDTPGKETKVFIEANPQFKTVNLYSSKMQYLGQEQRQELMQKPEINEQGKEQKQEKDKKQELDKEDQPGKKQSRGAKKAQPDESGGLLPKKRTGNKKGLSV